MNTPHMRADKRSLPRSESIAAAESIATEPADTAVTLSAAERHRCIAEAAYLRAADRGFSGDQALDDWLAAEREFDARTAVSGTVNPPVAAARRR